MTDQEKEFKKKEVKEYCTIFKTKIKLVPFSFLITEKKVFGRLYTFFFLSSRACQKNFESLW